MRKRERGWEKREEEQHLEAGQDWLNKEARFRSKNVKYFHGKDCKVSFNDFHCNEGVNMTAGSIALLGSVTESGGGIFSSKELE